jgi:hypothetical protein
MIFFVIRRDGRPIPVGKHRHCAHAAQAIGNRRAACTIDT